MVSVAGLILAACLCVPWAQSAAAPPSDVFSPLDYGQAFAAAIADDLVLLVYGTADWSSPCNRMEFSTWYMPEVVQALSGVALAIRVDVDEQPVLARNLGISVVPTIIAFRKGEEIDRRTAGLVSEHFLEWFDAVRQGLSLLEQRRATALAKDTALQASADAPARHAQAVELFDVGEFDRALSHYLWLWEHVGKSSRPIAFPMRNLLQDLADLARRHVPARTAFDDLQSALYARIRTESRTLAWHDWTDWLTLSAQLENSRQVLNWLDEVKDADGRLPDHVVSGIERRQLLVLLERLLIERHRWQDAAGLGVDLLERTELLISSYKNRSFEWLDRSSEQAADKRQRSEFMKRFRTTWLRSVLSTNFTLALLAGHRDAAWHIADQLLEVLDDAESRMELVRTALEARLPAEPKFSIWLDEAEALGHSVDSLRIRLELAGC